MQVPVEDILKIVEAFIAGALLGLEREYRSKPAGLRTLIMITVGSTLFSILSSELVSNSPDRIASNIVTGVGFVGAGVIFKEGLHVKGITTAATIWAAAAIGMAIGFGNYWLAASTLLLVIITLLSLQSLEEKLDSSHQVKTFKITFDIRSYSIEQLEGDFRKMNVEFHEKRLCRQDNDVTISYNIVSIEEKYNELTIFLLHHASIKGLEV